MSFRRRKIKPPSEVSFPVTPFLDMAFQLLAFFILTFRAPSRETRIDLYLPSVPATLPSAPEGRAKPSLLPDRELDLETDLVVRAQADGRGRLKRLALGDSPVETPEELGEKLRRYVKLLEGRPLRIRLIGDDSLLYDEASKIIGACASAGVDSIRLAEPHIGAGAKP